MLKSKNSAIFPRFCITANIHTLNGKDYAIFIHEMGDDAEKRLESWPNPNHSFDQWFAQNLNDCYDTTNPGEIPIQPTFFGEIDARK